MQVYHGTRYIDEVVGLKVADLGRVYLHQDHNYNVAAMTDLTGRVLERNYYSPYGELEAVVDAHPFDYDDDGVVDDFDLAAATTGGDCWNDYSGAGGACKRLDANADCEIDADYYNAIEAYVNSLPADGDLQRTPSSPRSLHGNPFAHQGLVLDAEIASYQNRARQYAPSARRFVQRDPLVASGPGELAMVYYSYEYNSPYRYNDPSGMVPMNDCECTPPPPTDTCASPNYNAVSTTSGSCTYAIITEEYVLGPGMGTGPNEGYVTCTNVTKTCSETWVCLWPNGWFVFV